MPAAKRRDAITVQRLKTPVDSGTGELAVEDESNWVDFFPCFAEIIVKGTREFTRAGILDADISHIVRVPRSTETDSITEKDRLLVLDNGDRLHIEAAYRRNAASREIEMLCRS